MNSSHTDFIIPEYALKALTALENAGFEAHIVGGCVRDFLLGKAPHDFDMTTSAFPDETKKVFEKYRVIETGIKHGTVTVLSDGYPLEITTYRTDGEYKDHRHPENVSFSRKLSDDLSRRDFTVNAMCYSPKKGITDLFGGCDDIKNKVIRCVGDPCRRFDEDALRILRGLRFSSVLSFDIEEKTACAMAEKKDLLNSVSAERILTELNKLLTGADAKRVLCDFRPVFEVILPDIKNVTDENYSRMCDHVSLQKSRENCLAAFLLPLGEDAVKAALKKLKADNRTSAYVLFLTGNKKTKFAFKGSLLRDLGEFGSEYMKGLWDFLFTPSATPEGAFAQALECFENGFPCRTADLALKGNDISALGFRGREIGSVTEKLLVAVTDGIVENKKENLILYIENCLK